MPLFSRTSARRREIRRSKAESQIPFAQRVLQRVGLWPIATAVCFGLGAAIVLNIGGDALSFRAGMTSRTGVSSRVAFEIEDEQATLIRRTQARDNSPAYYVLDTLALDDVRGRLSKLMTLAAAHAAAPEKLREEAAKLRVPIDDAALAELQRLAGQAEPAEFLQMVDRVILLLSQQPLVEDSDLARRRAPVRAILAGDAGERQVFTSELLLSTADGQDGEIEKAATAAARDAPKPLRAGVESLIAAALRGAAGSGGADIPPATDAAPRPIYRYDSERTMLAERQAEAAIPVQTDKFSEKALLADVGVIDEHELKLLAHEQEAYLREVARRPEWRAADRLAIAGRAALAFIVAIGLAAYVAGDRSRATRNPMRLAGVALVVLGMLAIARLAFVNSLSLPAHFAVGAQALAAALLTIVYARRFAFAASGALALLITMATQRDVGFVAVLLTVNAVMIIGLRDVRNRGKIVLVGLVAGAAACGSSLAAAIVNGHTLRFALWQAAWAGGTTLAAAFIVEGVLPFIERLFRLSSNVTLLEWCDANKPLLRTLAARAPGTYNHSLVVGSMAEAAAEAVGVNGLLARAGAYYHDIGKMNKPHYFIENTPPGSSRHEGLSPAMSLLIIIAHVKDGIEMAKEYNLPASLIPFIAEHHGTTLVEYFYHAANKERRRDDPEVAETQFRYPGPKPQSRETAIVMLCDGVEGAVRSMPDPTPARIEGVVGEMVRKRLLDGQFDECDLTFRELALIEQSVVKSLCGIYHGRIAYPANEEKTA